MLPIPVDYENKDLSLLSVAEVFAIGKREIALARELLDHIEKKKEAIRVRKHLLLACGIIFFFSLELLANIWCAISASMNCISNRNTLYHEEDCDQELFCKFAQEVLIQV